MDDIQNPSIEGSESFVVFLSSPHGAVLQEPYEANVVITDTFQDSTCNSTKKIATFDTFVSVPVIFSWHCFVSRVTASSFSSQHAV